MTTRTGAASTALMLLLACSLALLLVCILLVAKSTRVHRDRITGHESMRELAEKLGPGEPGTGRKGTIVLTYDYWDGGSIAVFGTTWEEKPLYIDITAAGGSRERWTIRTE